MIHVCVPVLKRYDLLAKMVESLQEECVIHVIDNGRDPERMRAAMKSSRWPYQIAHPEAPLGVAASWNWFIDNVPEERVIVNDDVIFGPDSLKRLTEPQADLIWAEGCGFSCFVIRDSCIDKLGVFDETISPGYGYYEDDDYLMRLDGRGTKPPKASAAQVDAGIVHAKSQTMADYTPKEMEEHHRKFWIAQTNYINKWNLQREFGR